MILFLRTKTDNPPPLPEVAAAAPAAGAAPARRRSPRPILMLEVAALVAKADPAKGEADAAICKVCHAFEKGAPSPVGPNLYGVRRAQDRLGRRLQLYAGDEGPCRGDVGPTSMLDRLIHKPAEFAPGTMMAFPGLPDAKQRADVIAFLRTKADSPYPLPEAAAAPAENPHRRQKRQRRRSRLLRRKRRRPRRPAPAAEPESRPKRRAPKAEEPAAPRRRPHRQQRPKAESRHRRRAVPERPTAAASQSCSGARSPPASRARRRPSTSGGRHVEPSTDQPQPAYPDGEPQ